MLAASSRVSATFRQNWLQTQKLIKLRQESRRILKKAMFLKWTLNFEITTKHRDKNLVTCWGRRGAKACKSGGSCQELSNELRYIKVEFSEYLVCVLYSTAFFSLSPCSFFSISFSNQIPIPTSIHLQKSAYRTYVRACVLACLLRYSRERVLESLPRGI